MRFWTSDTHFGHARINDLSNRGFRDVDDMNQALIDNWNKVVKPDDWVVHLGDVALGTIAESLPLLGKLNGRKALFPGNHDRIFDANKGLMKAKFFPIYQRYFDYIAMSQGEHVTLMDGTEVFACHFPRTGDHFTDDRYPEYRPTHISPDTVLLHGHVHEMWKVNGNQFNVGVDVNDFTPVPESAIVDWIRSL